MSLFNESGDAVTPDKAFEILTGPGGKYDRTKYADEAEMYKAMAFGKLEADRTIEIRNRTEDQLRNDYKKLREEYNAGPSLKETLDQYFASTKAQQTPDNTPAGNDSQSVFDENKAQSLFKNLYQQTKAEEQAQANVKLVESKLKEAYGEDYSRSLKQKVSELGLTEDFVNGLAATHPQVLFKTLELDRKPGETFQAPAASTRQIDPSTGKKRTWSYYDKMRKENPTQYHDPKTKAQMQKDYAALGKEFEDGTWMTPKYNY